MILNQESNLSKESEAEKKPKQELTWEDKKFLLAMTVVIIGFSLRGGEFPGSVFTTLRGIFVSIFYGFGLVFLFIGLTKKTFKYNPTKIQIIKWAFAMGAIFAVSQFFHEGYLMITGQMPVHK